MFDQVNYAIDWYKKSFYILKVRQFQAELKRFKVDQKSQTFSLTLTITEQLTVTFTEIPEVSNTVSQVDLNISEVLFLNKFTPLSQLSERRVKVSSIYYSTITSFYHIRTRERAKYDSVLHCSKRIAL